MKRVEVVKIVRFDDDIPEGDNDLGKVKKIKKKQEVLFIDPEINYNIRILHKTIIKHFDELDLKISEFEKSMENMGLSDRDLAKRDLESLKRLAEKRTEYVDESRELLEEYSTKKKEFQRVALMKTFLPIAKNYINVNYKTDIIEESFCIFCGEPDVEERCNGCGALQKPKEEVEEKKATSDFAKSFEALLDIYEGKKKFPKMEELKKIVGKRVLSSQQIIKIIKENKLGSKKFIGQIMNELYKSDTLFNLSSVRRVLLEKFLIIQKIYQDFSCGKRKNSLTCKFILHVLLHIEGFDVDLETLKTIESKIEHVKIMKDIFIVADIKFPDYEWPLDQFL